MEQFQFEWDKIKDKANQNRHRVSFETASLVFDDPLALSFPDRVVGSEERYLTLGSVGGVTFFSCCSSYRDRDGIEVIRIISARKATKHERRQYE